ncbi:MAG: hypothetical protein J5785_04270 [Spirochaetales bacterium]|nr:hypothetical protein [Spirochaetales bacterium]
MTELKDKFCEDIVAACYMVDRRQILRPSAFLDLAQQMAVFGADRLDFGDDTLGHFGCTWVLARQHVRFERPLRHKERGRMLTWHKGLQGLFFIRDYQLLGADGEPCVNSTSSWVVMNVEERRVVRPDFLREVVSLDPQSPDSAIAEPAAKVGLPRESELSLIGTRRVLFSDVDYNQHANNVKYTVWAMDALPEELVNEKLLKELTINFNKEARPGETVELWHALDPDGAHIVEGRVEGHQVFIERLIFD